MLDEVERRLGRRVRDSGLQREGSGDADVDGMPAPPARSAA